MLWHKHIPSGRPPGMVTRVDAEMSWCWWRFGLGCGLLHDVALLVLLMLQVHLLSFCWQVCVSKVTQGGGL